MKTALACILLCAGVGACTGTQAAPAWPADWTRPTTPVQIFDGVYWVGSEGLAAYLFDTGAGLVLLDAGMPEHAEQVAANIRTLGFEVEDIRYLLNSHAHFDHSGGLARLKAMSGAELVASAGDQAALETGTYPGWEDKTDLNFPPVQVDRVIADGETLALGDLTLTAYVTPGHSEGCTSWAFDTEADGAPVRAMVFCSASVAANRLTPDPQFPGIVEAYRRTFARMAEISVDAWLMPHAEQFDFADKRARMDAGAGNPFVDPTEKDRRMAAFAAAFEERLAQARSAAGTP